MNDLLDDQLRTMMRTATADAPEAPTVDDLRALVVVHDEPTADRRRPLLAAAAAVLALGAVGALVFWPGDDAGEPADTPDTTAVVPGGYLDAYYLPAELPDGWQIVQMDRYPGTVGYLGDSAVFETRDGSVRALIEHTPVSTGESFPATAEAALESQTGSSAPASTAPDPSMPPFAADSTWDPFSGSLNWHHEGRQVWLTPSDGQEATARSLVRDLVPSRVGIHLVYDLVGGSDWVQTAEYLLDGGSVVSAGENSMQFADETGAIAVIGITRTTGARVDETGTPVPGEEDLYRPVGSRPNLVVRSLDDLQVSAFSFIGSVSTTELVALLRSLTSVTEEEWLAARPDPNELVAGATVVATFELLDHTVTAHREGGISGVCVARSDGASGCAFLLGVEPDGELPPAAPTNGIPLSDGTWVAVGSIANGLEPCEEPLLQGARAAVVPNGDVQTMLVIPADQDASFACPLTGTPEGGPTGAEVFIANPPLTDD